ncbi:saccharopine dehydrogenase NADP-binding domain-containing protein [Lentzea sp.]|uniref:saccharopine dehydrogenase NADP-binding domain-containing protein n=1 Tax=Lentzea sp. TaxID=56099 RepID=UPI002C254CFC|nr:saccharopine dehydrogenase NADP-binding domain-containing protein [Lentzea sp.]HUQ60000.1 saccharopine dehydrogenase NADP-binding domain-containing protein [Lentzea sp.]
MSIWVLGATGRVGRAVTTRLLDRGETVVLVGRESARLRERAANTGLRVVVADTADRIAAAIEEERPAVVINTIGSYAETAATIARACVRGGGHYLDQAADLTAVPRLLGLHDEAAAAGSTLVTGAGFGVMATEAVVATLCEGRPAPADVRVDAVASVAIEEGALGTALAASIIDVLVTGGRRYRDGRLTSSRIGAGARRLLLPDGEQATTSEAPSAELLAAHRSGGAPAVTSTTALMPASPVLRAVLPFAGRLLALEPVRRFAIRRMAAVTTKAAPGPRTHSWGHAVVTWPDGTTREGWLKTGDAMDFTAGVSAEVAVRLARGEGKPGAYTPAAAFGPDLAIAAGGEIS